MRMLVGELTALESPADIDTWLAKQADNDAELAGYIKAFGATDGARLPSWTPFLADYAAWVSFRDAMLVPAAVASPDGTYDAVLIDRSLPLVSAFVDDLDALDSEATATGTTLNANSDAAYSTAVRTRAISLTIALAVALALGSLTAQDLRGAGGTVVTSTARFLARVRVAALANFRDGKTPLGQRARKAPGADGPNRATTGGAPIVPRP